MNSVKESLISFASNHKKKLIITPLIFLGGFYLYKKYLSENVNFYYQIYKQYNDLMSMSNNSSHSNRAITKYEHTFNKLLSKMMVEISSALNSKYPCDSIWEKIQNGKDNLSKNASVQLWINFKDTNCHSFFSSIFITRISIMISQTSLLLLEKINIDMENSLPPELLEALLSDLWTINGDYIKYLMKYIDDKVTRDIQDLSINSKLTYVQLWGLIDKVRDKVLSVIFNNDNEIRLNLLAFYIDSIKKKIESLENQEFQFMSRTSANTNYALQYFCSFYDLLDSNLFNIILLKIIDYDLKLLKGIIVLNFENADKEVSVPKIINYLVKIRKQLLDMENSIFVFKNLKDCEMKKDLEEFFKVIFDS